MCRAICIHNQICKPARGILLKILSCVAHGYYASEAVAAYEYISFVDCPVAMGHVVHHFDYRRQAIIDREAMNAFFLTLVKTGSYDLVVVVTNKDEFDYVCWTRLTSSIIIISFCSKMVNSY